MLGTVPPLSLETVRSIIYGTVNLHRRSQRDVEDSSQDVQDRLAWSNREIQAFPIIFVHSSLLTFYHFYLFIDL